MRLKLLVNPMQRAWGAMLTPGLEDTVLAFVYPFAAPRTFYTYFCPPLRIVALSNTGETLFDQVVPPGRFVNLPSARYYLEFDPAQPTPDYQAILEQARNGRPSIAGWGNHVSVRRLMLDVIVQSIRDIYPVFSLQETTGAISTQLFREHFTPVERGNIVNAAGMILDYREDFPIGRTEMVLSRRIIETEAPFLDELAAVTVAGVPWQNDFDRSCLFCGKPASWRPVIDASPSVPPESAWRYQRPENHVPLCHHCNQRRYWNSSKQESYRISLACGLWGARFEAFYQWHLAVSERCLSLPRGWQLQEYPLWPKEYGGNTWAMGSGALLHADPRPPDGVARSRVHQAVLARALHSPGSRMRHRPNSPLRNLVELRENQTAGGT